MKESSKMNRPSIGNANNGYIELCQENSRLKELENMLSGIKLPRMVVLSVLGERFETETPSSMLLCESESFKLRKALNDALHNFDDKERPICWVMHNKIESVVVVDIDQQQGNKLMRLYADNINKNASCSVAVTCSHVFNSIYELPSAIQTNLIYADYARFMESHASYIDIVEKEHLAAKLIRKYPGYMLANYERAIISATLNNNLTQAEMITNYLVVSHLLDGIAIFPTIRMNLENIVRLIMALVAVNPKELSNSDARYVPIRKQIRSCETLAQMQGALRSFFVLMAEYLQPRKIKQASQRKLQEIVDYINANFSNPMISMALVCDQFNISVSYLSHKFKEQMGINLSTYIQTLRIEEAKNLLANTDMTVDAVAGRVGYSNGITLLKRFKKIEGITPSVYKEFVYKLNK